MNSLWALSRGWLVQNFYKKNNSKIQITKQYKVVINSHWALSIGWLGRRKWCWSGKGKNTCSPVKVANVGCGLWVVVQVYIGIDGRWWEGAWRMERGRGGLTWEASSIHNSSHCHPAQKGYTPTFKISYKYNLRWTCAFSFPSSLVSIACPDLQEKFPYHQTQNQIFCLNHVDENAFSCFSKIVPKQINHPTDNLGGTICHVTQF